MAHPDLDNLLNAAIPFAQQMLVKHGEFFPFGVSMKIDGRVDMDAGYTGAERPSSQEIIDLLTRAYRQQAHAGSIRAAGICFDIRVIPPGQSSKTDAICVSLEHQCGDAADLILPYTKSRLLGRMSYGEIFGCRRERAFFTA